MGKYIIRVTIAKQIITHQNVLKDTEDFVN